jgi:hypothetical protein
MRADGGEVSTIMGGPVAKCQESQTGVWRIVVGSQLNCAEMVEEF